MKYIQTGKANDIQPAQRYKHFKGGEYQVIALAKMEADGTQAVVYKAHDDTVWVRSVTNWQETVKVNGKSVPRFELIKDR